MFGKNKIKALEEQVDKLESQLEQQKKLFNSLEKALEYALVIDIEGFGIFGIKKYSGKLFLEFLERQSKMTRKLSEENAALRAYLGVEIEEIPLQPSCIRIVKSKGGE